MSPDQLAAIGAFLSGVGSVAGAVLTVRALRKRMRAECEERLELFRQGIRLGEHHGREVKE